MSNYLILLLSANALLLVVVYYKFKGLSKTTKKIMDDLHKQVLNTADKG